MKKIPATARDFEQLFAECALDAARLLAVLEERERGPRAIIHKLVSRKMILGHIRVPSMYSYRLGDLLRDKPEELRKRKDFIYLVCNGDKVLYVGITVRGVYQRLREHIKLQDSVGEKMSLNHDLSIICLGVNPNEHMRIIESVLIEYFDPPCNRPGR